MARRCSRASSLLQGPETVMSYDLPIMFEPDCWKGPAKPAGVMTRCKLWYAGLGAVLAGALSACAWGGPPAATEPAKPDASLVEMISGGLLLARTGKPELGLTLANNSGRTLWAQMRFRTPNGQHDCLSSKELEPKSKGDYLCPQPAIQADSDYPVQIIVFGDRAQTQTLDRFNTRFRFSREDVQAVGGR